MESNRRGSFEDLNAFFVFGALSILLLHILGFFIEAQKEFAWNYDIEAILIILLRFSRAFFIFGTGMLLFYWYRHRDVDWSVFWRKRWVNIILPYLIWTGIYTYTRFQTTDPSVLVPEYLTSLISGSSFYHLYYIPLYLQVTVLFMLSKRLIENYIRFRHVVLIGVFQMILYGAYQYFFSAPVLNQIDWNANMLLSLLKHSYVYNQLYVYMYLFYFLLGAFAGLHVDQWRIWVRRLAPFGWVVLGTTSFLLIHRYLTGKMTYLEGLNIFTPLYMVYTLSLMIAFYPVMARLGRMPHIGTWLSRMAKHNMAIYMTHPLILFLLESYVIYHVRFWSVPAIMASMFILTVPVSIILYNNTRISTLWVKARKKHQHQQQMQPYRA